LTLLARLTKPTITSRWRRISASFEIADIGIVPLTTVVDALLKEGPAITGRCVAISFDDAPDFDYYDVYRPELGHVKSFARILRDATPLFARLGLGRKLCGTSFAIASRAAREVLDRTCIAGLGEWRDSWWREAHRGGYLQIANHSWDHAHDTLPQVRQREQRKGDFFGIDNYEDADAQIRQAEEFIESQLGCASARLFAFPYGEPVDYLVQEYLPRFAHEHKQRAAFITDSRHVLESTSRWCIPRFVCGWQWKSPEGLRQILLDAAA
jgi:peptidoglycan/xylan/chitin deacetylase (PgdA/CDA1 family)